MNLKNEIREIEKLYDLYSSGEFSIAETDDMDDRIELFRTEIEKVIDDMPVAKLRDVMTSEEWIITDDLNGVPVSDYKAMAKDALYEDVSYMLIGCKKLLETVDEN